MHEWKDSPFKPKEGEDNWIASVLTIGALIGAMFVGICMDFLGRKKTLIGLGIPYAIGWLLMGLTNSFWPILIGRALTGIAIGITTAVLPTYIAEISTPNIRGMLGMSFNFFVVFGMVYVGTMNQCLPDNVYFVYMFDVTWNKLSLWCLLPAGLLSITMIFMPESPTWCVNKIRDTSEGIEQAMSSLKRLRTADSDVKAELNELIEGANRLATSKNSKLRLSPKTLTRRDVYKPLLIGMMLLFFQQFCGINAVQFYLNEIFKKSSTTLSPKVSTLIANIFMCLATVLGGAVIDRAGRRLIYAVSAFGLMSSIAALGVFQFIHRNDSSEVANATISALTTTVAPSTDSFSAASILPIVLITIFVSCKVSSFSIGCGPLSWVIITEITPPQTIGLISSTSSAFAWIFTFLVVNYTGSVRELIFDYGTYWFFASMSLCSAIFIYFLPETKGKTMEQMVKLFKYDD
ncbi:PREDICTED: facilitated trehalose transporter Tret1-like [Rhagoletis zephyria]|uniref:facilitated trehalose transporter Tret1-like n=1 Tax=Rhagoletis zephyria TaxID=28612 RepID=UPI0008115623|nr:PREDICTED: facilitated trehalose transporter Tret1-like [Rhagoletis zephyria]